MRNSLVCLAGLLLALVSGGRSDAADWPHWRGPDRDGRSPDVGLLKAWPDGGPKLLWKATGIGTGYASVAVAGGKVYTAGKVGGDIVITAFDMNGRLVWKATHGTAWTRNYPGSRATPTVDGGSVFYLSGPGLLGCYDARSGSKKWAVDIKSFGGRAPRWGYSESALIYKNTVVVTPGDENCIVALDKTTGRAVWKSKGLSDPAHYSSCIAFTHGKVPMIATLTGTGMVCVSAGNGQFLWRNNRASGRTAVCPTPVYSDGYVFGASGYGNGGVCVKLDVAGGRVNATQAWETMDMNCHHGGFVIVDGYVYGNHGQGWNCLDLRTGEKKWGAQGVGKGSICYADGMLYTFSENGGRMGLVEAKPDAFVMRGQFRVEGSGKSWAHPVVVGGRLYLRYAENLYAYDVRDPSYKPPAAKKPAPATRPRVRLSPRPKPAPPRPKTPEEQARRMWNLANNFLMNKMTAMAKAKFEEIVEKYPDTTYATMAARKLRELGGR